VSCPLNAETVIRDVTHPGGRAPDPSMTESPHVSVRHDQRYAMLGPQLTVCRSIGKLYCANAFEKPFCHLDARLMGMRRFFYEELRWLGAKCRTALYMTMRLLHGPLVLLCMIG
jgi:hypothetical protein